ncbi:hypothetical protein Goshw_002003 [Gossypium schwendimanii]|uniref:Uncharacterized protein n=1 Tax=Gossypium schwendimanii TaxID=34291 RepID=A0A7J9KIZ7_GOSSC|nr:hypothetical protein [Gossypium schwendimanii]
MVVKETLLVEELNNIVKIKEELADTKRKKDPGRGGLRFVNKGKNVEEKPIVFVKALTSKEISESSKPMVVKPLKKVVQPRKNVKASLGEDEENVHAGSPLFPKICN